MTCPRQPTRAKLHKHEEVAPLRPGANVFAAEP